MSLMLNKNDLQEFLCKFKGHNIDQKIRETIQSQKPTEISTNCLRCNCKLHLTKITEHTYLISKDYEEEENDNNEK